MADINEVNGAFGGVEFGNNQGVNVGANVYNPYGFGGTETTLGGQYNGNTEEATNYDRGFNYGDNTTVENTGIGYTGTVENQGVYKTFGGTEEQTVGGTFENATGVATVGTNLPVKSGFWSKVKAFCFTEISVKLTPHQQKIENEINDFFNKEITWASVKNFFGFGKKKKQ